MNASAMRGAAAVLVGLLWSGEARAQAPAPTPQFDMLGFIEAATLDAGTMCPGLDPALWGGTVTLNGITMTVPCNTILQMPATALTWAQLFDPAVSAPLNAAPLNGATPPAPGETGLALSDSSAPFPSFEIRVVGNVVKDAAGTDRYVIGLIAPISQQGLNASVGTITCIDYANGYLYVGGAVAAAGQPCAAANGVRVQVNDPLGRFGLAHSPDPRFTADLGNPTVHASTGYPVCVPRVAPAVAEDPLCPVRNRPLNGDPRFPPDPFLPLGAPLKAFDMRPPPGQVGADPTGFPDSRQQLPLMVGDWITFSGELAKDAAGQAYLSAHTLIANLGVFTAPGSTPVYVSVETILLGTGGAQLPGLPQEATTRIFIVGNTTDPTQLIDINAIDVNPCTGEETSRLLGTVDPATQPVRSRFRFHVLGGGFMPPTREMLVVSHAGPTPDVANGLTAGQYRLPNFDFVFAENLIFGQPIVPNNFQDLPFLAQGSGPLFGNAGAPRVGQLLPWPGVPAPPPVSCAPTGVAPLVSAGADIVVGQLTEVTLFATVQQDPNAGLPTITWIQTAGPVAPIINTDTLTPTFVAPALVPVGVPQHLTFQVSVTDAFGTATSSVNVTVVSQVDVVIATATWRTPVGGIRQVGNKGGKLTVTATSSVVDPSVVLTAVGWGAMTNLGGGNYALNVTGVAIPPDAVTVRSSLGGTDTAAVLIR